MNFCESCGRPRTPGAAFCTSCGAPFRVTGEPVSPPPTVGQPVAATPAAPGGDFWQQPTYAGNSFDIVPNLGPSSTVPSGRTPAQIWLVAALLVVSAGFVLKPSITLIVDIASSLGDHGIEGALAVLGVVLALIVVSFGVGLLAVAWLLIRGDKAGRVLAFLLNGAVVLAEALTKDRGTSGTVALCVCIAVIVVLALPNANEFFRRRDDRPAGVVAAVVLIGYFAWDFALFGTAMLPLHAYEPKDLPIGIALIAVAVGLLALNRSLSKGQSWARVVVTLLLIAMAVLVCVAEGRDLSSVILAALAGGCIGSLWISPTANAYFNGAGAFAAQQRPAWGPLQVVTSFVAVACLAAVAALGFHATSSDSNEDFFLNSEPDTQSHEPTQTYEPPATEYDSTDVTGDYSYTWTFNETSDGQEGEATLSVGDPIPYSDGVTNGSSTLGTCEYELDDSAEAAAIPFEIELTNDSSSYDAATFGLDMDNFGGDSIPSISGAYLYLEAEFDDGPACDGTNGGDVGIFSDSIAPGSSSTTHGFFVIDGYYDSEASSDAVLEDTVLGIDEDESFGDDYSEADLTVDSAYGPGLVNTGAGWRITLAGTESYDDE